jgi:hypothetical protein
MNPNLVEDLNPVRQLELLILMNCFNIAFSSDMIVRTIIVPPNTIYTSVIAMDKR